MDALTEYFTNIATAIWTVLVGMRVTFRHLFTPAYTQQYPREYITSGTWKDENTDREWKVPERARLRLFNNIDDCIGCYQCARACPVDCIYIDTIKVPKGMELTSASTDHPRRLIVNQFDINMSYCCYCGDCTYVCPTECLIMTPEYEFSVYDRKELIVSFTRPAEVKTLVEQAKTLDPSLKSKVEEETKAS